jgi:hypothetical protein
MQFCTINLAILSLKSQFSFGVPPRCQRLALWSQPGHIWVKVLVQMKQISGCEQECYSSHLRRVLFYQIK